MFGMVKTFFLISFVLLNDFVSLLWLNQNFVPKERLCSLQVENFGEQNHYIIPVQFFQKMRLIAGGNVSHDKPGIKRKRL